MVSFQDCLKVKISLGMLYLLIIVCSDLLKLSK